MAKKTSDYLIVGSAILFVCGSIAWIRSSLQQQTEYQVETVRVEGEVSELEKQIDTFESEIPRLNKELDSIEAQIDETLVKRKLANDQRIQLMARYKELQTERAKADELTNKVESMLENTLYLLEKLSGENPAT